MNRKEGYKQLMQYGCLPLPKETVLLQKTDNGATGVLKIMVAGWYYVKIAGGGASAQQNSYQNTATGSSSAGFIGEIYLASGNWDWKVGRKGVSNQMQTGEMSYLLRQDNHEKGIICNPGIQTGYYPAPQPIGGILEQKDIKTRNVIVASNGNDGHAGGNGTYEKREAYSVLLPFTGEQWGASGSAYNDNARQGTLVVKFMGV